jgi:indolepyruvate ferredoxin oxidoreductase alpha subunit
MAVPNVILALADGFRQSGCELCTNHPGFHSQRLAELLDCRVTSRSERAAFATAWGASLVGCRAVVTLKNVGLNDAADPFLNASCIGCNGGLVCVVFDDIDVEQSQIRLDSRFYRLANDGLWIEPTSIQDAYAWASRAFAISERFETVVVIRVTNILIHALGTHTRTLCTPEPRKDFSRDPGRWVMHPSNVSSLSTKRQRRVADLQSWSDSQPVDADWPEPGEEFSVLVGAQTPNVALPPRWARLDRYPVPATLGKAVESAPHTVIYEHGDAFALQAITAGLRPPTVKHHPLETQHPNRIYHNRSCYESLYGTFRQLDSRIVVGDIGSHTMDPHRTLDACLCYGSSVAVAAGVSAGAPEHHVICVTGDGGFSHSGRAGLAEALDRRVRLVVFVIDNGGCQDTGGQLVSVDWPHASTGLRLETWTLEDGCRLPLNRLMSWFAAGGVTLVRVKASVDLSSPVRP